MNPLSYYTGMTWLGKTPLENDFEIIKAWLTQPELEGCVFELFRGLATVAQDNLDRRMAWIRKQETDGLYDFGYYYEEYDKAIADRLMLLTRKKILEKPITNFEIRWAKKALKGSKPARFYQPLYQLLIENGVKMGDAYNPNEPDNDEDEEDDISIVVNDVENGEGTISEPDSEKEESSDD